MSIEKERSKHFYTNLSKFCRDIIFFAIFYWIKIILLSWEKQQMAKLMDM